MGFTQSVSVFFKIWRGFFSEKEMIFGYRLVPGGRCVPAPRQSHRRSRRGLCRPHRNWPTAVGPRSTGTKRHLEDRVA